MRVNGSLSSMVIRIMGALTGLLVLGSLVLTAVDKSVPDPVWTLAGGGLGALSTFLVSSKDPRDSTDSGEPRP